jgi:hypothetical protein
LKRPERWQVYGDTGITEMVWAMAVEADARVMDMGCAMGSIYSGDPRVD